MFKKFAVLLLFLLGCVITSTAQKINQKKGKYGVSDSTGWIIKPKYDSITGNRMGKYVVWKKGKAGYATLNNPKFLKAKYVNVLPFHTGFGLAKTKKGNWVTINSLGEDGFKFPYSCQKPEYISTMIYFSKGGRLYDSKGKKLMQKIQGYKELAPGHYVFTNTVTKQGSYKKGLIIKKTVKYTFQDTIRSYIHGIQKDFPRVQEVKSNEHFHFIITKRKPEEGVLIQRSGTVCRYVIRNVEFMDDFAKGDINGIGFLYDSTGHHIQFKKSFTDKTVQLYSDFIINGDFIYCVKKDLSIDGYKYSNGHSSFITGGMKYIRKWIDGPNVVLTDSNQIWIAKADLSPVTEKYTNISEPKENRLIASTKNWFRFLDANTFEPKSDWYADIYGHYSRRHRKKGFLNKLFARSYSTTEYGRLFKATPYKNGFAVVAYHKEMNDKSKLNSDDSLTVPYESHIKYNFINRDGKLINSKWYSDLKKFTSGKAYVKEGSYFHLIDSTGKRIENARYSKVIFLDNYYYIKKGRKWGIRNSNHEKVYDFIFDFTHSTSGVHYGRKDGEDVVLDKID